MNIAFFGSSLVSAYWNGAATYYRGIIRALNDRGHHITFYESDAYDRQQHRDIPDPDWARVIVYSSAIDRQQNSPSPGAPWEAGGGGISETSYPKSEIRNALHPNFPREHQGRERMRSVLQCLEEAVDADLIIKASGNGVFDELLEAAVLDLKKPSNLVAFWDVDAPATLDRLHHNPLDPFQSLIPQYDFVLTYGGGEPVVSAYESLGAKQCVPIYNALDPATHFPVPPDERFQADLGFLGNRLPDREARVEEFFLSPAGTLRTKRFLLGGSGWQDKPIPANVHYAGHVYTRDHNAFNCSPMAVLNISRQSMADYGFSPATRVFEAAGAGACLVTDYFKGIEVFFEPGEEILVARDGTEVCELLKELSPRRARQIGQRALTRALAEHTYAHRALLLDQLLGDSKPQLVLQS